MENRIGLIPLAVIPSAPARSIDSRSLTRAGAVCGWWILLVAVTVMAGCGNERDPARGPAAGRAGNGFAPPETYRAGEHDTLRTRTDAARNRLWVLTLEDVRVYDITKKGKKLIRQIALPNWSVTSFDFACMPDMALDRSGSAFVSSNVQAKLWRIDADSFEVKEYEISLLGREQWAIGFGALAFAPNGTLYALTSSAGSLWKIDVAKANASMIEPDSSPSTACAFTTQFLKDFERSQKPWTRPSPRQN